MCKGVQHVESECEYGSSQSSTKFFNENTRNELQFSKAFACSLTAELFAWLSNYDLVPHTYWAFFVVGHPQLNMQRETAWLHEFAPKQTKLTKQQQPQSFSEEQKSVVSCELSVRFTLYLKWRRRNFRQSLRYHDVAWTNLVTRATSSNTLGTNTHAHRHTHTKREREIEGIQKKCNSWVCVCDWRRNKTLRELWKNLKKTHKERW